MVRCLFVSLLAVFVLSGPAMAQEADGDRARRHALAVEMHEIRPVREQVDAAVALMAQSLPPADRDRFTAMVDKAFDYDALETMSVDAMADLFTAAELQAMVDYFGSDAAQSAAKKLPLYQEKLQPEIIRMLDRALARQRFGADPAAAPVSGQ